MSSTSALVLHVEIPVADLDRAARFYEAVFGVALERTSIDGYEQALLPAAEGGVGASAALVKGDVYVPGKAGPLVYFGTRDVEAALGRAEAAGGAILYPQKRIAGLGVVAEFADSEGNRIGLFAADG